MIEQTGCLKRAHTDRGFTLIELAIVQVYDATMLAPPSAGAGAAIDTCFDNGFTVTPMQYSLSLTGGPNAYGAAANCALSFQFQ